MARWLNNAIFYEIYPQSFNDSNGDGIGDFKASSTNCNTCAIWGAMRSGSTHASTRRSTMPATTYATTTQPRNATAATRTCSGSSSARTN